MSKRCKKGLHIYSKDLKFCPECKKLYYRTNKEKIKTDHKLWKKEHNESVKTYKKNYYINNKEKINLNIKSWRNANLQQNNLNQKKYQTKRIKADINYKLTKTIRSRISIFIRSHKIAKNGSAIADLGCSIEEVKYYLENKFYPNKITGQAMTWENYGKGPGLWAIDHIEPLCSFNLIIREQFIKACNYTNLQPLWHEDHAIKTIEDKKKAICQKE